jgi:hypothetical protein
MILGILQTGRVSEEAQRALRRLSRHVRPPLRAARLRASPVGGGRRRLPRWPRRGRCLAHHRLAPWRLRGPPVDRPARGNSSATSGTRAARSSASASATRSSRRPSAAGSRSSRRLGAGAAVYDDRGMQAGDERRPPGPGHRGARRCRNPRRQRFTRTRVLAYGDHILTIQPHPEIEAGFMSYLLRLRGTHLSPQELEAAIAELDASQRRATRRRLARRGPARHARETRHGAA